MVLVDTRFSWLYTFNVFYLFQIRDTEKIKKEKNLFAQI
jgi:hypothetical protein